MKKLLFLSVILLASSSSLWSAEEAVKREEANYARAKAAEERLRPAVESFRARVHANPKSVTLDEWDAHDKREEAYRQAVITSLIAAFDLDTAKDYAAFATRTGVYRGSR